MKVFTEFYEAKAQELSELHKKWVNSNKKINSIALALRQIKSEGDTAITPAEEVLKKELEKERRVNDKLCADAHGLRGFLHGMETKARENGVEWDKTRQIFGY